MQQRKSANGRPSGTDGSDFSYRMVVDNRYTKVAKEKTSLSKLFLIQAAILLIGALNILYSIAKGEDLDKLAASSASISFISLIIGEFGRKCSRVNFLKFYIFGSSLGALISIACVIQSNVSLKVIQDLTSAWETDRTQLFKVAGVLLGSVVQIFSISTTASLIGNMSPPKRAS